MPELSVPFFHQEATHELIENLADASSLTLFAGAGISKDYGSPDWKQLVAELLADFYVTSPSGRSSYERREANTIAARMVDAVGPMVGASIVRQLYDKEWGEAEALPRLKRRVHHYLYKDWAAGGPLLIRMVNLALTWVVLEREVAILTTNYDDNLSRVADLIPSLRALRDEEHLEIRACVDDARPVDRLVPVYHLNGLIPFDGRPSDEFVFSETGFALGDDDRSRIDPGRGSGWQLELIQQRLRQPDSTFIFLATSLTDPTVVDCLVRTRDIGSKRYAILPLQGDDWCNEPERPMHDSLSAASLERLHHLGVTPIRPDFYGQVSQFLNEIWFCAVQSDGSYAGSSATARYGQRLEAWYRGFNRKVRTAGGFSAAQDRCQSVLQDVREDIGPRLRRRSRERLKVEIWLRQKPTTRRTLTLWCTSDAAGRSPDSLPEGTLTNNSGYAAVQAFCQGHVVRGPLAARTGSRWRSFVSIPIVLPEAPWYGLPVGVITLLSTADQNHSCLAEIDSEEVKLLTDAGIAILEPEHAWPA